MSVEITLKNYRCFPDNKPLCITLTNDVTAFLGANNSGKSSVLKFFHEFRHLFDSLKKGGSTILDSLNGGSQQCHLNSVKDCNEVFSNISNRGIELELKFAELNSSEYPCRFLITIPKEPGRTGTNLFYTTTLYDHKGSEFLRNEFDASRQTRPTSLIYKNQKISLKHILETFEALVDSLYIPAFRNALNAQPEDSYYDISIGRRFIAEWKRYKSGSVLAENQAAINVTHDIKDIFHFHTLDINPSDDDKTLKLNINGKSYTLFEVGSGLAQVIQVFVTVAMKKPTFIFIDEPELNLHPSLQFDFLTALASYAKRGVVFATHNIGLARACADRIYSFRTSSPGVSECTIYEDTPRLSEFLGELSFSSYKELGFDKVLLVEGPTDIKAIQQFLRTYKKDHKVVILPLGGSGMINGEREQELQEITRICNDVSALIDSERIEEGVSLSPERTDFKEICKELRIRCHVLERRATENYLTDRAVKRVKGEEYSSLEPYQKLKDIDPKWSKTENWRIAREMNEEDLNSTDLGKFLKAL